MSARVRTGPRPAAVAPWLLAGAVAAVAYALWPQSPLAPTEGSAPPPAPVISPTGTLPNAAAPLDEWIRASNQLMDEGRFDAAVAGYTHALHLDSQNVALWVDRGACRHSLGDLAGAEADFLRALRIVPEHPTAHFNLGIVYYSRGIADSAKLHFNFVVNAAPGSPEAERAGALISLLSAP